jgi:hypothetical protein
MIRFSNTITIDREPAAVFAYFADFEPVLRLSPSSTEDPNVADLLTSS